jgi:hypothetical protein
VAKMDAEQPGKHGKFLMLSRFFKRSKKGKAWS